MKIGSKAWVMFMRKIYFFSITLIILSLVSWFLMWRTESLDSTLLLVLINIFFLPSIAVVCIMHLLSIFEPIHEAPNWKLVFKQLNNNGE